MTFWIEMVGWAAVAFTFAAYSMKTMLPLRVVAILANISFVYFSYEESILPTLVLHLALLPLNVTRLVQILKMRRKVRDVSHQDGNLEGLRPLLKAVDFDDGSYVFRKGDPPDRIYVLDAGEIELVELGKTLKPGELFGEIAFFTEQKVRTLSAKCKGPCRILTMNENDFLRVYYQDPSFGFYIIKLVASRLYEGIEQRPDAYRTAAGGDNSSSERHPV